MIESAFLNQLIPYLQHHGYHWEYADKKNNRLIRVKTKQGLWRFFGAAPQSLWPENSRMACSIAGDKELTLRLCAEAGLAVPLSAAAEAKPEGKNHQAMETGKTFPRVPLVVKPNSGRSARGLSFLYGKKFLKEAVALAAAFSRVILFQEMLDGEDLRYYVFKGRALCKIIRQPFSGKNTSREFRLSRKSRDREAVKINLPYPAGNFSLTHDRGQISRTFSPEEKKIMKTIYDFLGLNFFALDGIMSSRLHILEINGNPGVEVFFHAPPPARECLEEIFYLNLEG